MDILIKCTQYMFKMFIVTEKYFDRLRRKAMLLYGANWESRIHQTDKKYVVTLPNDKKKIILDIHIIKIIWFLEMKKDVSDINKDKRQRKQIHIQG